MMPHPPVCLEFISKYFMDYTPRSMFRKIISKEFMSPEHEKFRKWYFKAFTKSELLEVKDIYYQDLEENQKMAWFFDWFKEWYPNQQSIRSIGNFTKDRTTADGETKRSIHPFLYCL